MANSGFGGAVKLTGESEYRKALSEISQGLKVVSAEMKATASAFDADNMSKKEAIATSKELKASLESQGAALQTLKSNLAGMQAEYSKTASAHNALLKEYDAEKAKLEQIGNTLGKSSNEYKAQEKVVDDLSREVQDSTKSYDNQTKSLNALTIQTANAETTFNQTAKALDEVGKKSDEASKGWTVLKQVLANLATQAVDAALSGLKKLGTALVDTGKQALDSYAKYEQLEGGVRKLFGDETAQAVIDNANRAFSTAGMSANQYMETVTSFSARLLTGLGGDTKKAAEYADMAIRDMADNANVFGSSMDSIQNAYQGFAKQNYTMLDNLKLGYGGTKEEMARLVRESGILGEAGKDLNAKNLDLKVSYDQIIEAIHITQQRMQITGTTAKEAAGTIEGSVGSMKAAWQNMITGIANPNADFATLSANFVNSLLAMFQNTVPRIATIIEGLAKTISTTVPQLLDSVVPIILQHMPAIVGAVDTIIQSILKLLPQIMPVISTLIPQIANTIISMLPTILSAGVEIILSLIDGITKAIPQLVGMLPKVVSSIVETLLKQLPQIIKTGLDFIIALTDGIIKAIPQLVKELPKIVTAIVQSLTSMIPILVNAGVELLVSLVKNLPAIISGVCAALPKLIQSIVSSLGSLTPQIVQAGVQLFVALVSNMPAILAGILKAVPQIILALVNGLSAGITEMAKVGLNLIKGLWQGISDATTWLWSKISEFCNGILSKIKKFFGIKSPSRVFRDEIGANLAEGVGLGFTDTMQDVARDMQNAIPTDFNVAANVNGSKPTLGSTESSYFDLVSAFKTALAEMKIELDDEVAGRFVETTVARAIYT